MQVKLMVIISIIVVGVLFGIGCVGNKETSWKYVVDGKIIASGLGGGGLGGRGLEPWDSVATTTNGVLVLKSVYVVAEMPYRDGKINGEVWSWLAPGRIDSHARYVDGKIEGPWSFWWPNGQKQSEVWHVHGVENGNCVWWNEKGIKSEEVYYTNGVPHGVWRSWYPDGVLKEARTMKMGTINGVTQWWCQSGKLVAEGVYTNGVMWEGTFCIEEPGKLSKIIRVKQGQLISEASGSDCK